MPYRNRTASNALDRKQVSVVRPEWVNLTSRLLLYPLLCRET